MVTPWTLEHGIPIDCSKHMGGTVCPRCWTFCDICNEGHSRSACRGYPICHRCKGKHKHYECPEEIAEKQIAIEESRKKPVPGTNGETRAKTCNYCKLWGHTGYYCPKKYRDYPDIQPYVEKFPGEEAVYEAIQAAMEHQVWLVGLIEKQQAEIKSLRDILEYHSLRFCNLEDNMLRLSKP